MAATGEEPSEAGDLGANDPAFTAPGSASTVAGPASTADGRASTTDGSASIPAGRVGRAHGLDGSFYVTGARARLLAKGATVCVDGRTVTIVRRAGTDAHPIVRLQRVEDRAAAEALRGLELTVERDHAPDLGEGEWWASELEGCEVRDGERSVGIVLRLLELPSCEALEVRLTHSHDSPSTPAGKRPAREILIPMVRDAIRHVDVDKRRIDVDMSFLQET